MDDSIKVQRGFTLIELSISLVIIGFIVGSMLTGQELIYQARIRKVGSELQQISVGINTFRLKYDCLPGDCANATAFFGVNLAGCPNGGGLTGTCDGNADGFINAYFNDGNIEHQYAWQQLSLANLIPWSFPINACRGGNLYRSLTVGQNIPASTLNPGIGYNFFSVRPGAASAASIKTIEIGSVGNPNQDVLSGAGLTAPQASALDSKFDDGKPESGKIMSVSTLGGSIIPTYNNVDTQSTSVNAFTNCVSSHTYLTTSSSGCTLEYKPDVP